MIATGHGKTGHAVLFAGVAVDERESSIHDRRAIGAPRGMSPTAAQEKKTFLGDAIADETFTFACAFAARIAVGVSVAGQLEKDFRSVGAQDDKLGECCSLSLIPYHSSLIPYPLSGNSCPCTTHEGGTGPSGAPFVKFGGATTTSD